MGQPRKVRLQTDRVFLVVELLETHVADKPVIECIVSLPGRDGVLRKTWNMRDGVFDRDQATDLLGWVDLTVSNGILAWTGVQGVLPMES
jgi:hypothetical protein